MKAFWYFVGVNFENFEIISIWCRSWLEVSTVGGIPDEFVFFSFMIQSEHRLEQFCEFCNYANIQVRSAQVLEASKNMFIKNIINF